jgi:TatD DNase family protein
MIIDSHCHLNEPFFPKEDLPAILTRAKEAGVEILQTVCTRISEFEKIKRIAEENKEVFCSIGNHPCYLEDEGVVAVKRLVELTQEKKVIAIGETGLDYYHKDNTRELQKKSFLNHIEAAQLTELPLIIHTRNAEEDMADILKQQMAKKKFKGVLHCFTGSKSFALLGLELGLYVSIPGVITFKNAKSLQEVVKNLPLNRLLVETDSPYLAPTPLRGKPNEPALIKYTVASLAKLLNKSFDEVAKATSQNFLKLFDKTRI